MTVVVTVVVLLAAVLHAVWNALTHAITDKVAGMTLLGFGFTVFGGLAIPFVGFPAARSWPYLLGSVVVHLLYALLLMRSFRLGPFNQVYPLARGMSPWLVAMVAALVLGEPMSAFQVIGVVVVSLGLGSLVFAGGRPHASELPAILAAVLTGLMIAGYTLLDGLGVRQSTTSWGSLSYAAWLFLLHGLTVLGYGFARRGRVLISELRPHWRSGVLACVCSVLAYGLVLWAQGVGSLAMVSALRETSVIVGAVIGAVAFSEPFGRWRIISTVVVASGIALLNVG